MEDIELVIKIPEEVYNNIKEGYYDKNLRKMAIAIGNGTPLEEELEKIKAEILKEYPCGSDPKDKMIGYGIHIALEYIDNHISELKGENKQ